MTRTVRLRNLLGVFLALAALLSTGAGAPALASPGAQSAAQIDGPPANGYAIQFVATAAFGAAMNAAGDVVGTSYVDTGCGPWCLPPLDTVVWLGGVRYILPTVPGLTGITPTAINSQGWVAGYAGLSGTTTHAVIWKLVSGAYQATDLGTLPGTTISTANGIDELGRVIGWSTTATFPPNGSPFMWTEAGGMVDLSAQGYPDETPTAISPGGTVLTAAHWYILENLASVHLIPAPPQGFYPPAGYPASINDAGDSAMFLTSTSNQSLVYPFRLSHSDVWQQISFSGTGHLSSYGIGSINAANDVTATTLSTGVIAYGPSGMAQNLSGLISPAYAAPSITLGGPQGSSGQILTRVIIGQSSRLVRLVPATACTTNCIRISSIVVRAKFVQDPAHPGQCFQGGIMYNRARITVTVTNELGAPLSGVTISGRLLDDYWTDAPLTARTNRNGIVSFNYTGQCGVGALAFFTNTATKPGYTFDNTTGVLTAFAIPQ